MGKKFLTDFHSLAWSKRLGINNLEKEVKILVAHSESFPK